MVGVPALLLLALLLHPAAVTAIVHELANVLGLVSRRTRARLQQSAEQLLMVGVPCLASSGSSPLASL
jgi:hypothetical protein